MIHYTCDFCGLMGIPESERVILLHVYGKETKKYDLCLNCGAKILRISDRYWKDKAKLKPKYKIVEVVEK